MRIVLLGVVAALVATTGCTPREGQRESAQTDEEAVERMMAELDGVVGEGDLEAFLARVTEDVVVMPPGEASVVGREALRAHHRPIFDAFRIDVVHEPVETRVFGDAVFQWGNSGGSFTPRSGGAPVDFDQKYLFVFLRQPDGSFKIWRAMFNDNAAPTEDPGM